MQYSICICKLCNAHIWSRSTLKSCVLQPNEGKEKCFKLKKYLRGRLHKIAKEDKGDKC